MKSITQLITEFLHPININKFILIIKNEYKDYINEINIKSENICIISFKNNISYSFKINKNNQFVKFIKKYGYKIHWHDVNTFIIETIESNKNDIIYKQNNGIIFHITNIDFVDSIRKNGLRIGIGKRDESKYDNNTNYPIYVLSDKSLNDINNDKLLEKLNKEIIHIKEKNNINKIAIIKFNISELNIDFNKDNAMNSSICYFTYNTIPNKFITNIIYE